MLGTIAGRGSANPPVATMAGRRFCLWGPPGDKPAVLRPACGKGPHWAENWMSSPIHTKPTPKDKGGAISNLPRFFRLIQIPCFCRRKQKCIKAVAFGRSFSEQRDKVSLDYTLGFPWISCTCGSHRLHPKEISIAHYGPPMGWLKYGHIGSTCDVQKPEYCLSQAVLVGEQMTTKWPDWLFLDWLTTRSKHQRQQHSAACRSFRFWELLVGV